MIYACTYIACRFCIANRLHNWITGQNFPFNLRFKFIATDGSKISHGIFGRHSFTYIESKRRLIESKNVAKMANLGAYLRRIHR